MRVVFLCGGFKWANSVGLGRAAAIGPGLDGLGPPALDGFWGRGVPMGVSVWVQRGCPGLSSALFWVAAKCQAFK